MKTKRSGAFTLLELLAVMMLMAVMLALGAASLLQSRSAPTMASEIVHLKGLLDQGRQLALARNKYVQVRFYARPGDEPAGYSAVGLFLADSPYYGEEEDYLRWSQIGAFRPAARLHQLPDTLCIAADEPASRFLADLASDGGFARTGKATLRGEACDWVAFYFLPNGATDFQTIGGNRYDPQRAYFTLVGRQEFKASRPRLPANFATFAIPPATGRPVVIRP